MATSKKGITVRFEDDEMAALESLAKKYRVTSATIIRWALTALHEYVELHGGKVVMPLDFSAFYAQVDRAGALKKADEATSSGNSRPATGTNGP